MPSFQLNPLSRTIADLAISIQVGGILTYGMLQDALGFDVRPKKRYLLDRGLQLANEEVGAIFDTLIGIGYRRKPQDAAKDLGITRRRNIRRVARKSRIQIVNAIKGMNDIPKSALQEVSALCLQEHLARDSNLPPIKDGATKPLSYAESMATFMRMRGIKPALAVKE